MNYYDLNPGQGRIKWQWHIEEFLLKLEPKITDALEDSIEMMADSAKDKAPVKTGRLKNSIYTESFHPDKCSWVGRVISPVPYTQCVEFGTRKRSAKPFMRQAFRGTWSKVMARFRGIIG
uniref:Putative tail protein n=1 Tax=viral metagenome TaxID=1070528 RepID=A0A6H1ZXJ0_9ZZZZ